MCFGTYHFFIALPAPPDIFVPKHVVDHQPKKRSRPISKKDLHDQHESLVACHAALVARHAALVDALVTSKGLFCPITQEAIVEPVVAADGHTYERLAIVRWLSDHHTSPVTGLFMRLELLHNRALHTVQDELHMALGKDLIKREQDARIFAESLRSDQQKRDAIKALRRAEDIHERNERAKRRTKGDIQ